MRNFKTKTVSIYMQMKWQRESNSHRMSAMWSLPFHIVLLCKRKLMYRKPDEYILWQDPVNSHSANIIEPSVYVGTSLVAQLVKNLPAVQETWVPSLGWEDPQKRAWQHTPVFFPEESPWTEEPGRLSDMTEWLSTLSIWWQSDSLKNNSWYLPYNVSDLN